MRGAVASALALCWAVAACDRGAEPEPTPIPPTPVPVSYEPPVRVDPSPAAARPAGMVLTSDGYGPVRVGMTEAEAARALGPAVQGVTGVADDCHWLHLGPPPANLLYMVEQGRVTRVTLNKGASAATAKGLRLGATEAAVRAAHGSALEEEPHKYVAAPAKYLTFWDQADTRGVRFVIDQAGVVEQVHAGDQTIRYVEGCA